MEVYLFRHADAVDIGEAGATCDAERVLSDKGRKQAKMVAQALRAMGCQPEIIATSPLPRARETADIAGGILGCEPEILDLLAPGGGDLPELAGWIGRQKAGALMLVGHLPDLPDLGVYLASGSTAAGLSLKKAGVLCISMEPGASPGEGAIEWLIQPRNLKGLTRDTSEP